MAELKLSAAEVQALIRGGLPAAAQHGVEIAQVTPHESRIRFPFHEGMLRPGGVISGPTLFAAADTAMYALVLARAGAQLMAVTSNMNINFLNKAAAGDVLGHARLLKFGRRLVVMDVALSTSAAPEVVVAHATGSYALPMA